MPSKLKLLIILIILLVQIKINSRELQCCKKNCISYLNNLKLTEEIFLFSESQISALEKQTGFSPISGIFTFYINKETPHLYIVKEELSFQNKNFSIGISLAGKEKKHHIKVCALHKKWVQKICDDLNSQTIEKLMLPQKISLQADSVSSASPTQKINVIRSIQRTLRKLLIISEEFPVSGGNSH